jgi:hypothetical protein
MKSFVITRFADAVLALHLQGSHEALLHPQEEVGEIRIIGGKMILHAVRRDAADIRDAGSMTKVIVLVAMMGDIAVGVMLQADRLAERMMMMGHDSHDQHPHAGQQK